MPGSSSRPRHPGRRDVFEERAVVFTGTALFPRLAHRLRWPTRVGPRGFVAYVAYKTSFIFAIHASVIPALKRMAAEEERASTQLAEQPRREPPGDDELLD